MRGGAAGVERRGNEDEVVLTREAVLKKLLPLPYRDRCAPLLIPLNACRLKEFYLPWKCVEERHVYEKCEYELFLRRVKEIEALRAAQVQQKQRQLQQAAH